MSRLNQICVDFVRGLIRSIKGHHRTRRRSKSSAISAGLRTVGACEERILLAATFEFVDPHPEAGNGFGDVIVPLSTGNVVIVAPYDDAGGTDAGAVYLFHGATGKLISKLTGSRPNDKIGLDGVTALRNGNFVVRSSQWDHGTLTDAGAVTWGNGKTGIVGVVSSANSLVGSHDFDALGKFSVTALSNGNYVVNSPNWDSGLVTDAGAVTWGNGRRGISGVVNIKNSLVGTQAFDQIGGVDESLLAVGEITNGVAALANGNYVVRSGFWDRGSVANAGAVTWGNGQRGVTGYVNTTNSLVGSQANDAVGGDGLTVLSNGNYVVNSSNWTNGSVTGAGAVTWGNGRRGIMGVVSPANSLVGSQTNDHVGYTNTTQLQHGYHNGVTALRNGNYVVSSPGWNLGSETSVGAVTWGNGAWGLMGVVSSSNSLIGNHASDSVGSGGVTALSNGNYVVSSPSWNDSYQGAVTWGNGSRGTTGIVSSSNSLVGNQAYDSVGSHGVTALSNGNYVVNSPFWANGLFRHAGAVTWGNGATGVTGVVSSTNSLIGNQSEDTIGLGRTTALSNGNYVVSSPSWNNEMAIPVGAATWGNGASGTIGIVSSSNSLVGSHYNDQVSAYGIFALSNGNYVVNSAQWSNGSVGVVGAVTWGNGQAGITGVVSSGNSLIGSHYFDFVGRGTYDGSPYGRDGVIALRNGNYLIISALWTSNSAFRTGAVTWGNGQSGTTGLIHSGNSLIGLGQGSGISLNTTIDPFNQTVIVRFFEQGISRVLVRTQ